eukprot:225876-Pelagomonas_calceolata.AAC.4
MAAKGASLGPSIEVWEAVALLPSPPKTRGNTCARNMQRAHTHVHTRVQVRMPRETSSTDLKSRIADAKYELIPIDHGFCLPETLEAPYFEWLHWPQAMLPFSEEELAYIKRIDIEVCVCARARVQWLQIMLPFSEKELACM